MATPPQPQKTAPKQSGIQSAVSEFITPQIPPQFQGLQVQTQFHMGPVSSPEVLEKYNALVPGTAERMIGWAETESNHRREMEKKAIEANIQSQQKQNALAEMQINSVRDSDKLGQYLGAAISIFCIAASFYLAFIGNDVGSGAIATIPLAAIGRSFFVQRGKNDRTPPNT
jgi:uncharacterized membrane protein